MKPKWIVLIPVVCLITACSANQSLSPAEAAYRDFFHACEDGDLVKAETYLTDKAVELLQDARDRASYYEEGDPFLEELQKYGDPCYMYLHSGINSNGAEFDADEPDAVEYRELDFDKLKEETGVESKYEGVVEMADLKWFVEDNTDPDKTTYITTIQVIMVKINGEWKIDCGWC